MSKLSALDGVYTAGIKAERIRLRKALSQHLRIIHGWNDDAIASAFIEVGLDRDPWTNPVLTDCLVCGQRYDTQVVYGQPLHEKCIDSLNTIAKKIAEEG